MTNRTCCRYRLKLSENMKKQGYAAFDEKTFPTYKKAYLFVIEKWGGAILNDPLGLRIQMKKPDGEHWSDCR